jgi:LacI family transcriptional regulator
MKDVAKLAGVSISTVSRVINNTIPVEEETRRKVEEAIRKVNFKPNLLARGLRSKSGHMIGLVVPEILHQTFTYWIKYAEESVAAKGMNLILGNTQNDPDLEERFIDSLIQRHIDGIIFSRVSDKSHVLHILEKTDIPFVVLDRALGVEDVPTVVLDNYKAGFIAGEYLSQLGHRKVVCITGPLDIGLSRERLQGFRDGLKENEIDLPEEWIIEGDFGYQSGIDAAQQLFSHRELPDAIWAHSDLTAIGVMNQFSRNGYKVPEDVSIMGMDNISMAEMKYPTLTTIDQPYREMIEKAIDMIIRQRKREPLEKMRVVLEPSLIVRESTGE